VVAEFKLHCLPRSERFTVGTPALYHWSKQGLGNIAGVFGYGASSPQTARQKKIRLAAEILMAVLVAVTLLSQYLAPFFAWDFRW
jgi:hypothetical protein